MSSFKKAQTATEYMIILAVIIIIALIVVGVMGGIPGLGGATRGRAQSSYWQAADIGIPAAAISATVGASSISLKLRNNLRDTITITKMNISASGSGLPTVVVISANTILAPGETKTANAALGNTICAASGNSFTVNVWVKYTNDETGAVYEFRGDGNKLEGKCAA